MTFYEARKELRKQLHQARVKDKDQSDQRYLDDGNWLDAQLKAKGFSVLYATDWVGRRGRYRLAQTNAAEDATEAFLGIL
jgi:hypothetical protein